MQAAQQWARDDLSTRWWLVWSLWLAGNTLLYALVWPGIIEVRLVLFHHLVQVSLAQDEEKVQALPSHTTQEALADGVGRQSRLHLNGMVKAKHSK
jgi:hypothetical protein